VGCGARSVVAECHSPSCCIGKTFSASDVRFHSTFQLHIHVFWFCLAPSSLVLLWELGIRDLRLFLFYLPLGFLILTLMVRVAPFLVPPRLYVGKPPSAITKLDLSR
jgi:hypothetical protein